MKSIIFSFLLAFIVAAAANLQSTTANAACNYSKSYATNCADAITDAAQKTVRYPSNSYRDVEKRVDGLRDALKECHDCAMDHVTRGTSDAFSTSTSTSTDD